ncbi:Methylenetetrahydrofolate--tRNA-(uracil-5-)-methyltransferase TrmFO 1 [Bienertia sinuspersici]
MGLQNLTNDQKLNWERLTKPGRAIQETKFADPIALRELGLRAPVQRLMGKVGLQGFLNYEARTYERYTLEFLSTLTKGRDEEGPFITFHLNDEEQKMYYDEVMEAFGWEYVADDDFLAPGVFNEAIFYGHITNGLVWHARCKSSSIPHPALRFVHRLLAMTLFCHGEPTHLPKFDLKCLWAMTPEGVGCPDWVEIFVANCLELSRKEKGKISMGGMVTLLANYLDIGVPTDEEGNSLLQHIRTIEDRYLHTRPSNVYNFEQLKRASMLWIAPQGAHYVWLYGANSVKYMSLPQRNRTNITAETSMAQLYLTPDEQYQAGVEEELGRAPPQQQRQGHGGGQPHVQQAQGGGFQEQVEPPIWQTMFNARMDAFESTQHSMEMRLDHMQYQMDGFEDNMYSMSSMVSAMNQFYVSHYPDYHDPSAEIELRRQQRQAERANRRGYREPGGPSGS